MSDVKNRILLRVEVLAWFYLILFVVLKIFGYNIVGLEINNERLLNIMEYIGNTNVLYPLIKCFLCSMVVFSLYMSVLDYKKNFKKLLIVTIIYSFVLNFVVIKFNIPTLSIIYSMTTYFAPLMFGYKFKECIKIMILEIFLQSIMIFIKVLDVNDASMITAATIYIDYLIMLFITYINKERRGKLWLSLESDLFSYQTTKKNFKSILNKSMNLLKCCKSNAKKSLKNWIKRNSKLNKRTIAVYIKVIAIPKFVAYVLYPLIIVIVVSLYAYIKNKELEAFLFIISYVSLRCLFPKTFHADYIPNIKRHFVSIVCTILSIIVFILSIHNTMDVSISILYGIIIALAVDTILYYIKDYIDVKTPENEIKKLCRDCGINKKEDIEFVIDYKFNGITVKEQSIKYNYTEQTVRNKRTKLNKLLKN